MPLRDLVRLEPGPVNLHAFDPRATPGFDGDKADGKKALAELDDELNDLQQRLYANARAGDGRRILLVLQGMDTSGKGGVMKHAAAAFDPQGLQTVAFGKPTEEEAAHDFLWRIRKRVPAAGQVGIFDRSHYEDVLIGKVREQADPDEIERRYEAINDFESELVEAGATVVKCMLHISADKQRERLLARLDDPHKHWKFDPGDVDERRLWSSYQRAYEIALERCHTDQAPWLIVPSDRKWYRNWAVATILRETLDDMDLSWPTADYDVAEQRARLLDEGFA